MSRRNPTGIGDRFGRLVVTAPAGETTTGREQRRVRLFACQCDCGSFVVIRDWNLRSGNTQSCGCLQHEHRTGRLREAKTTHGMTDTPTWRSWKCMLDRTLRCTDPSWRYYGGRGITVCEHWRDFENFLADMGERPQGTTLDRIDNSGNYEPGNCRWATPKQQAANRRPWGSSPCLIAQR